MISQVTMSHVTGWILPTGPMAVDVGSEPDWSQVPVVQVPLHRFVIPLQGIQPGSVNTWHDDSGSPPVHAFSRWADHGSVDVSDGRHRILRALIRGEDSVATRLLVIE